MRRLRALLLAAAFAAGGSSRAGASLLTPLNGIPGLASGNLGISIGALPPIGFPCTGCPVTLAVSSGPGSFTEPAGLFGGTVMLPTGLFTGVALINGLTIAGLANGTKFIDPTHAVGGQPTGIIRPGGGLGGYGPLSGAALINVGFLFNLTVPLAVIGNTGATTFAGVPAGIQITVLGTGWTTATVTLTGVTTGNPATNTVIHVGYDNRNAAHSGVVQLISPFKAITNAAGNLPGLATQTLFFIGHPPIPEPGTLIFLGTGVVGLVLYGLRRSGR